MLGKISMGMPRSFFTRQASSVVLFETSVGCGVGNEVGCEVQHTLMLREKKAWWRARKGSWVDQARGLCKPTPCIRPECSKTHLSTPPYLFFFARTPFTTL